MDADLQSTGRCRREVILVRFAASFLRPLLGPILGPRLGLLIIFIFGTNFEGPKTGPFFGPKIGPFFEQKWGRILGKFGLSAGQLVLAKLAVRPADQGTTSDNSS